MGCASSDATATANSRYEDKSTSKEDGSNQAASSKSYRTAPPTTSKPAATTETPGNSQKTVKPTVRKTSPEPAAGQAEGQTQQPVLQEISPEEALRPPSQQSELYRDRDGDVAHEFWEEDVAGRLRRVSIQELQRAGEGRM
mmetsp:Transcript_38994/g.70981  ORF Transcript_38994/g.70981 Transcript_38994/m.70981 type:complete len:141 (-) Transcript_38994:103-525(-)